MSSMVIFGKDFNPKTDMVIKEKKQNRNGTGSSAGIVNVNTSRSLFIQTPMMLTWGVNEIRDKKTKELQGYSMSLQFPRDEDANSNEEMDNFLESMLEFDELIKAEAIKNSMKWCKQPKLTKESVKMLYDPPVVKYPRFPEGDPREGEYDTSRKPTIRVKLPFYNKEFNTEIYDTKMKRLFPRHPEGFTPPDIIGKADNVIVIMQCGGVWFANGKFGVTWKLHQAILQKKENLRGRCFIQLTDEQKAAISSGSGKDEDEEEDTPSRMTSGMPRSAPAPMFRKTEPDQEAEAEPEEEDGEDEGDIQDLMTKKTAPRFKKVSIKKPAKKEEEDEEADLDDLEDDLS